MSRDWLEFAFEFEYVNDSEGQANLEKPTANALIFMEVSTSVADFLASLIDGFENETFTSWLFGHACCITNRLMFCCTQECCLAKETPV